MRCILCFFFAVLPARRLEAIQGEESTHVLHSCADWYRIWPALLLLSHFLWGWSKSTGKKQAHWYRPSSIAFRFNRLFTIVKRSTTNDFDWGKLCNAIYVSNVYTRAQIPKIATNPYWRNCDLTFGWEKYSGCVCMSHRTLTDGLYTVARCLQSLCKGRWWQIVQTLIGHNLKSL